ncbi:MAG TPA: hypothetical protein VJN18_25245 [Polyangiaceae bacterium]|nr:hypothetical protein [Polyangiaceae bacterium]
MALPAGAQAPPTLAYAAPAGCPDEPEFRQLLSERGAELQAAGSVTALEVRIEQRGERWLGTLGVSRGSERSGPREVTDVSCHEVARGLSVVAALALGAPKEEESASPASPVPSAEPSGPVASPAPLPASSPAPSTPEPAPVPVLRGSSFGLSPKVPVEAGTLLFRRFSTYTLAGGVRFGLVPAVLPNYGFTISSAPFLVMPGGGTRLSGPIVQVRWSFAGPGHLTERGYDTDLWALSAIPSICSGIVYGSTGLSTALCGEFEVGVLQAKMEGSGGSAEREVAVAGAGLGLDAQYHLGSLFHLGCRAGVSLHMPSSPTAPDGRTLFEPSFSGGYVQLGLGLHF